MNALPYSGRPSRRSWVAKAALFGRCTLAVVWGVFIHKKPSRSEVTLQSIRQEIDKKVEQQTTALHRFSRQLQRVRDEERRTLARRLHDSTAQQLVALKFNLEIARRRVPEDCVQLIDDSVQVTDRCISEIRSLSYLLHPPLLDEMGLESALHWFVDGFSSRSGIAVRVNIATNLSDLSPDTELVLFRVMQECLTNVQKHSGSRIVEIAVSRDEGALKMDIRDYGRGISPAGIKRYLDPASSATLGFPGIRERVDELSGQFEVISGPVGTTVRITLPVQSQSPSASEAA
ncbi:MAG TPA: sensor histidine kinase [Terriglobales bacterium]